MARCRVPRYIRIVDAFPMTVTGKIETFGMRQMAIDELRLQHLADTITAGPLGQALGPG